METYYKLQLCDSDGKKWLDQWEIMPNEGPGDWISYQNEISARKAIPHKNRHEWRVVKITVLSNLKGEARFSASHLNDELELGGKHATCFDSRTARQREKHGSRTRMGKVTESIYSSANVIVPLAAVQKHNVMLGRYV